MTRMDIAFSSQPPALRYMAQAFRPSPGWSAARYARLLSNLARRLSVLLPHVSGFRLLMVLLTHAAWQLPIWGALQVHNRLLLHRPLAVGEGYELQTRPLAWRDWYQNSRAWGCSWRKRKGVNRARQQRSIDCTISSLPQLLGAFLHHSCCALDGAGVLPELPGMAVPAQWISFTRR